MGLELGVGIGSRVRVRARARVNLREAETEDSMRWPAMALEQPQQPEQLGATIALEAACGSLGTGRVRD